MQMNLRKYFKLSTILFILMNFGMARSSFSANVKSGIETNDTTRTELTVAKPQETNASEKISGMAVAGFVCSILGLAGLILGIFGALVATGIIYYFAVFW